MIAELISARGEEPVTLQRIKNTIMKINPTIPSSEVALKKSEFASLALYFKYSSSIVSVPLSSGRYVSCAIWCAPIPNPNNGRSLNADQDTNAFDNNA